MLKLSVLAGFLVAAGSVAAGWKEPNPVTVWRNSDGTGAVRGNFGDTRATPDTHSYLDCYVSVGPGYRIGYCNAYDATSTFGSCWTSSPAMLTTFDSLDVNSALNFYWNADGSCGYFTRGASSLTKPSQP